LRGERGGHLHGSARSIKSDVTKTRQGEKEAAEDKGHVVFWIIRDSKCSECGEELGKGRFLVLEKKESFCLKCADLDHLVFLARGDAALTRRATKYSGLSAVVVRFSRARGRYERQRILVEQEALERAEQECLDDAEARARRRERDEERRVEEDKVPAAGMTEAIRELFPGCPAAEASRIAAHAAVRGSGRVGRTAAGKAFEESALTAAVIAHIRHCHTRYDELMMLGSNRQDPPGARAGTDRRRARSLAGLA
jgi:hypothetical protein